MFTEQQVSQIFKNWNAEMRALKANRVPNYTKLAWTNVARQFGAQDALIFKQEYYKSLAAVRAARRASPDALPYKTHKHHRAPWEKFEETFNDPSNTFPSIFSKLGLTRTQQAAQQDVLIADVLSMGMHETRLYVFSKQTELAEFKEAFKKVLKLYKYVVEDVPVKAFDVCLAPVLVTAVTRNG